MQHTLSILVENRAGVLSRISGLFARRGYNIESLVVGTTQDEAVSRITIVTAGDDSTVDQIEKQLNKLPDVLMVRNLKDTSFLLRQLILLKLNADASNRAEVMQIVYVFRAHVVDISLSTATIELTGTEEKIRAIMEMLKPYGIIEVVRTGQIAIERGPEHMSFI
jgi:acetolactate synthase-1/3 small subunit